MKTSKLLIILVFLLVLSVTIDKIYKKNSTQILKGEKKISPTITPTPSFTPTPTVFLPTNTPTPLVQNQNDNSNLIYPNSTIVSSSNNLNILQSTDDSQVITDWYKQKIKSFNLNANSFVQTNTNGNILNKLAGANGKREVLIEISKKANNNIVEIKVNYSN